MSAMEEQTWTIIEFEDNSVEAVPTTWIQDDMCYWPSYSHERLMVAIRKHEPLNTHWQSYKIRRYFRQGVFADYDKARKKTRMAENQSDINSSDIESLPKKRNRIPRVVSSSESEYSGEERVILPKAPKVKKNVPVVKGHPKSYLTDAEGLGQSSFASRNKSGTSCVNVEDTDSQNAGTSLQPKVSKGRNKSSTSCVNVEDINNQNAGTSLPPTVCKDKEKDIQKLIVQNNILKGMLLDTLNEVRLIRADLVEIKSEKRISSLPKSASFYTKLPFPLEDGMEELEEILINENEFENAVAELSRTGGRNPYELIKRIFPSLITDRLAVKYSWFGRKGKEPFQNLAVARLLISAALNALPSSSRKDVEIAIQQWLKRSRERLERNKD